MINKYLAYNIKSIFYMVIIMLLFLASCYVENKGNFQSDTFPQNIPVRPLIFKDEGEIYHIEDELNEKQKESISHLNESFKNGYPSYYAGYTIANKNLLILVIEEDTSNIRIELSKRMGNNDFSIDKARFDYKTLVGVKKEITNFINTNKNSEVANNIEYFDIMGNRVKVYLKDASYKHMTEFRKAITYSPVVALTKKKSIYNNTAD